jgi:hypothetical protein
LVIAEGIGMGGAFGQAGPTHTGSGDPRDSQRHHQFLHKPGFALTARVARKQEWRNSLHIDSFR